LIAVIRSDPLGVHFLLKHSVQATDAVLIGSGNSVGLLSVA